MNGSTAHLVVVAEDSGVPPRRASVPVVVRSDSLLFFALVVVVVDFYAGCYCEVGLFSLCCLLLSSSVLVVFLLGPSQDGFSAGRCDLCSRVRFIIVCICCYCSV